jgi:peptide/nickel transport system ATP-binding protein
VESNKLLLSLEDMVVHRPGSASGDQDPSVLFRAASFTIRRGEIIGLSGESGCGKSVFSRLLAAHHEWIQYIPQDYAQTFSPHISLERHIRLATSSETLLEHLVRVCGLEKDLVHLRRLQHVSGGQLQRSAIARALAATPRMVIADEITAAQDAIHKGELGEMIQHLAREEQVAFLIISHDLRFLQSYCSKHYTIASGRMA